MQWDGKTVVFEYIYLSLTHTFNIPRVSDIYSVFEGSDTVGNIRALGRRCVWQERVKLTVLITLPDDAKHL